MPTTSTDQIRIETPRGRPATCKMGSRSLAESRFAMTWSSTPRTRFTNLPIVEPSPKIDPDRAPRPTMTWVTPSRLANAVRPSATSVALIFTTVAPRVSASLTLRSRASVLRTGDETPPASGWRHDIHSKPHCLELLRQRRPGNQHSRLRPIRRHAHHHALGRQSRSMFARRAPRTHFGEVLRSDDGAVITKQCSHSRPDPTVGAGALRSHKRPIRILR